MKRPTQFYFYYFLFAVCFIGAGFNYAAGSMNVAAVWCVTAVLLFLFFRRSRTIDKNIKKKDAETAIQTLLNPKNDK